MQKRKKQNQTEGEVEKRRSWCQEFSSRLDFDASASILGSRHALSLSHGGKASNEKPSGLLWKKTETELFRKERARIKHTRGRWVFDVMEVVVRWWKTKEWEGEESGKPEEF